VLGRGIFVKSSGQSQAHETSRPIRVALIGFHLQKKISANQIIRALTLLPGEHLVDLLCVKYDPFRDIKFAGWYDLSQKGIVIFKFEDEWDFYQILYHEIAHHVFYRILTIDERYRWVNEISRSEGHVSNYARKNTHEDFAETYAQYICGPMWLFRMPRKFRFMNEVVFSGYIPNSNIQTVPRLSMKT
jgi:hypothetical protein